MSEPLLNIPTDGLVLYYDMRKPVEGKLHDYSGCGHHGTIYGAVLDRQHPCRGLICDGVDDYVGFPRLGIFGGLHDFTLRVLVRFDEVNRHHCIITTLGERLVRLEVWRTANEVRFSFRFSGAWSYLISNTVVAAGTWYDIAAVYDADVGRKLYINGVKDNEDDVKGAIDAYNRFNAIGHDAYYLSAGYACGVKGCIAFVWAYSRVLDSDEIKDTHEEIEKRILRRFYGAGRVSVR